MANTPEKPPLSREEKLAEAKRIAKEAEQRRKNGVPIDRLAPAEQSDIDITPEMYQLLTKLGYTEDQQKVLTPRAIANIARLNSKGTESSSLDAGVVRMEQEEQDAVTRRIEESRAVEPTESAASDVKEIPPITTETATDPSSGYFQAYAASLRKINTLFPENNAPEELKKKLTDFEERYRQLNVAGHQHEIADLVSNMQSFTEELRPTPEMDPNESQNAAPQQEKGNEKPEPSIQPEAPSISGEEGSKSRRRPRNADGGRKKQKTSESKGESSKKEKAEKIPLKHPWGSLGVYNELKKLENEFKTIYPAGVPTDILEKYQSLRDRMPEDLQKAHDEQRKTALEAQNFIEQERQKMPIPEPKPEIPVVPAIISPETPAADLTPAEKHAKAEASRSLLGKLIDGYKTTLGKGKEMFDWYKSSEDHLIRRTAELDAKAENIGGIEKSFRSLGEKYNKLPWYSKLAIGGTLAVGAGVSASLLSLPGIIAFTAGIGAQRVAGLSTMYLKFEKQANAKTQYDKVVALSAAIIYGAAMAEGMKELVQQIGDHFPDAQKFFKDHIWGKPERVDIKPHQFGPNAPAEVLAATPTPETLVIPQVDVEASQGHGYEWMLKRVWEDLQKQGLSPEKYPEGSDIRKLLNADAESIDRVVHIIAADQNHGFFKPDGSSVRIDLGSHMTLNADGNIEISGAVAAPINAPVTPLFPASVESLPHAPTVPEVPTIEAPPLAAIPEPPPLTPMENAPTIPEPPTPTDTAPQTEALEPSSPVPAETSQTETPQAETPVSAVEQVITNQYGLKIPTNEAHVYADPGAEHLMVFGGSLEDRGKLITEYLTQNPDKVIFASDDDGKVRLPWHVLNGKIMPGAPIQTSGFFGFFSTVMGPPEPSEFEKLIK